ncbi:MAG: glycosyltransferase [Candidatus Kapabacteria bacterium]|nr:glycosyltransferase [Ignavibacteriota bacterium]MCW5884360.1 glycosyltransferase [Candidatus Kapabacteria bacterium]
MNINTYIEKGRELILNGNYNDAKDILIECFRADNNNPDAIISIAECEIKMGNQHKALYLANEAAKIIKSPKIEIIKNEIFEIINNSSISEKLLTVAYIVKNEENSLPKSIASIKNVADEIIVVDTGSTDNTIETAKQLGAKVYYFDWINDYSAARNISIKHATSKWILYLDADERITEESKNLIRKTILEASEETGGLICEINSNYIMDDGTEGIYNGNYPRLFRNIGYPVLHFFGKVHEQISPSFIERGYELSDSPIVIVHEGYAISSSDLKVKLNKHIKTLTDDIQNEPYNGYTWYQLGNTLYQMKRYSECKEILENALKCGNLTKYLSANTALLLSRVEEFLGDMKSAFDWAHEALKYIDKYQHALIRKAEILQKLGKLDNFKKK